jgi:hypothetical protein
MKRNAIVLSLVVGLLLSGSALAQFNKGGRTAFQFVKIGVGARQTALGEASIAAVEDVNALFWNPAGIAAVKTVEGSFSYNKWFVDLKYMAGAVGFRWEPVGVFGISYASLDYGDIPEALASVPSGSNDTRTGSTFTGGDLWFGLTYCRQFSDRLSIGVTAKYLNEKLWTYSTNLWAFDFGTNYDTGFKGIRFGMSAQNFGKSVKFLSTGAESEGYDIPLVFRIGVSFDVLSGVDGFWNAGPSNRLTMMFEAVNSNDYGERWHVGSEYSFAGFEGFALALRGGYRFNYDEGNVSFGLGLEKSVGDMMLRADFSYVLYEFLESPYRVTVSLAY